MIHAVIPITRIPELATSVLALGGLATLVSVALVPALALVSVDAVAEGEDAAELAVLVSAETVGEASVVFAGSDSGILWPAVDSVADLATAANGADGIALPGGPTDTPRSRTSPFSISYTQPWMNTSASAPPSARR